MAKKLDKLPKQFDELDRVFRKTTRSGWSIGSAEGGWTTPSKADWGKPRDRAAERPARKAAS